MRNPVLFALAAVALVALAAPSLAQHGGGGGGGGGGPPDRGDPFQDPDSMRRQLSSDQSSEADIGVGLVKQQKYSEAIPHLLSASADNPKDPQIQFYLAYAHHMLGESLAGDARAKEFGDAQYYYGRSLGLDGDNKLAHRQLGMLDIEMNDAAGAADQLKALAALCPSGCDERDALTKAIGGGGAPAAAQ